MHIAILSPFNPIVLSEFLHDESRERLFDNHIDSSSINALFLGLINCGHKITVITSHKTSTEEIHLSGPMTDVYLLSEIKKPKERFIPTFYCTTRKIRCVLDKIKDEIDIIHSNWTYIYPYAAIPFANSIPTICTVRDWHPLLKELHYFKSKTQRLYHDFMFYKVLHCKNIFFVANSPYTKKHLHDYLHRKDIPIIPNSVRNEFILNGNREYPDYISIISIQQTVDDNRKNIRTLIKAFAKVVKEEPTAKLSIVGSYSTAKGSIYDNVCQLGLKDNISFLGKIPHLDLIPFLDKASVLVHPSIEETFGNIFLEATGRHLPVIGGKASGAVPQVLGNGEFGVLCDVTSEDSIANAIIKLHNDKEGTKQMIDKAFGNLITNYTEKAVAEKYIETYKDTIKRCKSSQK